MRSGLTSRNGCDPFTTPGGEAATGRPGSIVEGRPAAQAGPLVGIMAAEYCRAIAPKTRDCVYRGQREIDVPGILRRITLIEVRHHRHRVGCQPVSNRTNP